MNSMSTAKRPLFEAIELPTALRAQADKLLTAIEQARTATDCTRAADRAEGFVLGVETLRALRTFDTESLYMVFEDAAQMRRLELEL
ncbi:hypothetical protein ACIQVE_01775 [Pseudomonas sp. NPDC098747]|uniref:hypothetical protein n=1 Tax=Pseudomonas sp. NPDC098747 TaxID=3364487 RepID=UPI00383A9E4C